MSAHTPEPWVTVSVARDAVRLAVDGRVNDAWDSLTENACAGKNPKAFDDLLAAAEFVVNDAPEGGDAELTVKGYNTLCAAIAKAKP